MNREPLLTRWHLRPGTEIRPIGAKARREGGGILVVLAGLVCAVAGGFSAEAQEPQFQVAPEYAITSGGTPCGTSAGVVSCSAIAAGDFKGDGAGDDIAVVDSTGTVSIFLNQRNGSAGFGAPSSLSISGGTAPYSIATGSFSKKGQSWQDLVVTDAVGNVTLLTSSSGSFTIAGRGQRAGLAVTAMISADMNGDGITDVVIGDSLTGSAWVFPGAGGGNLSPPLGPFSTSLKAPQPLLLSLGNFTSPTQPFPDLIGVTQNDGLVAQLTNATSGVGQTINFAPATVVSPVTGDPCYYEDQIAPPVTAVASGFFEYPNGIQPQVSDLVVASFPPASSGCSPTIDILLDELSPPFLFTEPFFQPSTSPVALAVADVNGDSVPDLIMVRLGDNSAMAALGDGTSAFNLPTVLQEFGTGSGPVSLAVGNFHVGAAQPIPDLAVAHLPGPSGNVVSVLSNLGNGTDEQGNQLWLGYGSACLYNSQNLQCSNSVQTARTDYVAQGLGQAPGANAVVATDFYSLNSNLVNDVVVATESEASSFTNSGFTPFENDCNVGPPPCLAGDLTETIGPISDPTSPPANIDSMAAADFNADGINDLAIADTGAQLTAFESSGGSPFVNTTSPVQLPTDADAFFVASGVFFSGHAQNQQDLVVADSAGHLTAVSNSNDTLGNFTALAPASVPTASFSSIAAADLNGDGFTDVVAGDANTGSVWVFQGPVNSAGGFASSSRLTTGLPQHSQPVFVALGLNQNQVPVYLAAVSQDGTVALLPNTSSGSTLSFGTPVVYAPTTTGISGGVTALATGDFKSNGLPGLAIASSTLNQVWFLPNTSTGGSLSLGRAQSFVAGSPPVALAVADINQDGVPDLVVANLNSNTASVLISNGNGKVSALIATPTSSLNPSGLGVAVTFSTTVTSPSGNGQPTGTVQFYDGSTLLDTSALGPSGSASFTTSRLATGTHLITAVYSGNAVFNPRTSLPLTQIVGGSPDFVLSISPAVSTLPAGGSANFTVKATPQNEFAGNIGLACSSSQMPAGVSCEFSPATLSPNLNGIPATSTLTVVTSAATALAMPPSRGSGSGMFYASWMMVASILLGVLLSCGKGSGRMRSAIFALLVGSCCWQLACGGSSASQPVSNAGVNTPAGSYTISVNATAGAMKRSATVTVVVE
ncbi:MAG TPA: FG-GAP-like repeat-containing protein [Terriglobales bacterium]|nr:FG-GAP-like repeat-containing protein [Terriglobales bacterium]